ncbi:hypothetical protein [Mucilaginibacter sp.]
MRRRFSPDLGCKKGGSMNDMQQILTQSNAFSESDGDILRIVSN